VFFSESIYSNSLKNGLIKYHVLQKRLWNKHVCHKRFCYYLLQQMLWEENIAFTVLLIKTTMHILYRTSDQKLVDRYTDCWIVK